MKVYALGNRELKDVHSLAQFEGVPEGMLQVTASRHEYHVEALAVYTPWREQVRVAVSPLKGPGGILLDGMHCVNTEGVDAQGRPMRATVTLAGGQISVLYIAFSTRNAPLGDYIGSLRIGDKPVHVRLHLNDELVFDSGLAEPARLSSLKWLDDTTRVFDPGVVAGYEPIAVEGNLIGLTGKVALVSHEGLIANVTSFIDDALQLSDGAQGELFSRPMQLTVEGQKFKYSKLRIVGAGRRGAILAEGKSESMRITTRAEIGYEGSFDYVTTLTAEQSVCVPDISLSFSFAKAAYATGLGTRGGAMRDVCYRWEGTNGGNSVWVGNVGCGMRVTFLPNEAGGPEVPGHYDASPRPLPHDSWENHGAGGINLKREGEEGALLQAYTGSVVFPAGSSITFAYQLQVTPFHPLDRGKYYARQLACPPDYRGRKRDVEQLKYDYFDAVNLEYGSPCNPHHDMPIERIRELKSLILGSHQHGIAVSLSYSPGSLSLHAPRLRAYRNIADVAPLTLADAAPAMVPVPKGKKGADGAVYVPTGGRTENFFVGSLDYLIKRVGLDGVVTPGRALSATGAERVRKLFDAAASAHPAGLTLRLGDTFNAQDGWQDPMGSCRQALPFADRLQFVSSGASPDPIRALVDLSGLLYGVRADFGDEGDPWLPLLFGCRPMATKGKQAAMAAAATVLFNGFEVWNARMLGFWNPLNPVGTDCKEVLVTSFIRGESLLAVFYNATDKAVKFEVGIENRLGFTSQNKRMRYAAMEGLQKGRRFTYRKPIRLGAKQGMALVIEPGKRPPRKK